jgi:hypothetical protein
MKMKILLIALFGLPLLTNAQKDSLCLKAEIGIRGKWQTGNFAQFVINPNGKLFLAKKRSRFEVHANYEYLRVNKESSLINDFWSFGLYQYNSDKAIFPIVMTHYGFAQAYSIDHSLIGGLGIGVNLLSKENQSFFQLNIFSGYLNLKYKNALAHKSASMGSYIRLKFPLKEDLISVMLDSHAYVSIKESDYYSFNSRMILLFQIVKNLGINMTYSLVYNNNNPSVATKINGNLVFGLNYSFN